MMPVVIVALVFWSAAIVAALDVFGFWIAKRDKGIARYIKRSKAATIAALHRGNIMPTNDLNGRRLRLIEQILGMPEKRLAEVELLLHGSPAQVVPLRDDVVQTQMQRDWPHAPMHRLSEQGTYLVTAGTYQKEHLFGDETRRDYLEATLLALANQADWQLEAWAVFSNHYHFVGHARPASESLKNWLAQLHQKSAGYVNSLDRMIGRRVWYNYWETELTFERSYLARLNYVHQNAVKHGLASAANQYRWCSAAWFERTATPAQVRTIYSFKTDQINVHDDFAPR